MISDPNDQNQWGGQRSRKREKMKRDQRSLIDLWPFVWSESLWWMKRSYGKGREHIEWGPEIKNHISKITWLIVDLLSHGSEGLIRKCAGKLQEHIYHIDFDLSKEIKDHWLIELWDRERKRKGWEIKDYSLILKQRSETVIRNSDQLARHTEGKGHFLTLQIFFNRSIIRDLGFWDEWMVLTNFLVMWKTREW